MNSHDARRSRRGRHPGVPLDGGMIRGRRDGLGLTQAGLAKLSDLTSRTVQKAEGGVPVSKAAAVSLCAALGVPYACLVVASADETRSRLRAEALAPLPPPHPWAPRDAEAESALSLLRGEGRRVVFLSGGPGIGKSALARHVAGAVGSEFPHGVAWISYPAGEAVHVLALQLALADVLGFQHALPPPEAVGREAFDDVFRSWLWRRRRLLVLDDVVDPDEVRRFVGDEPEVAVLVTTTRRSVTAACRGTVIPVGPLESAAAVGLLEDRLGAERLNGDRAGAVELVKLLGGVPRSLQIAGQILARERFTRMSDYAERLRSEPTAADSVEPTRVQDASEDPDTSFAAAYQQVRQRLSAKTWRLFGALSLLGVRPFRAIWAAAASRVDLAEARAHLAELADLHLLQEIADADEPRFYLDAQTQRIAVSIGDPEEAANGLLDAALRQAREIGSADPREALETFLRDREIWHLLLDLATRGVIPDADALDTAEPDRLPEPAAELGGGYGALDEILANLRVPLAATTPAGAGSWLCAGIALAERRGDPATSGVLARLRGRWSVASFRMNEITGWCRLACERFGAAGQPGPAVEALRYAAVLEYFLSGVDEAVALMQEVDAPTREAVSDPVLRVDALGFDACMLAVRGGARRWEEAARLFERAVSVSLAAPAHIVTHIQRLNLALTRHLLGQTTERDAVETSLAVLEPYFEDEPLDVYRLDRLGQTLGDRPAARSLTNARRGRILLSSPPRSVPRTMIRLSEIAHLAGRPPDCGPDGVPLGVTGLLAGRPLELRIGIPGLLYPMAWIADLLDGDGLDIALGFFAAVGIRNTPLTEALTAVRPMLPRYLGWESARGA